MKKSLMNYETLLKLTQRMSMSREFEEITLLTVTGVRDALQCKGCALFLMNPRTQELEVAASTGLSTEYLQKGPISALRSIADALKEGPVAVTDVADDPRIQYPREALAEGIASILSVPMRTHGDPIGALRIYTSERFEFTLQDVNFAQAVAQIAAMAIEMARLYRGLKSSIEILKASRDLSQVGTKRWTPYEGVPQSAGKLHGGGTPGA